MAVKRAAKPDATRTWPGEPEVVQPGRVPQAGTDNSFREKIAGAGDEEVEVRGIERNAKPFALPETELEVRRWTTMRDAELDVKDARAAAAQVQAPSRGLRPGLQMGDAPAGVARDALWEATYRSVGRPNSLLDTPQGRNFVLDPAFGTGAGHTPRGVTLPLPQGHATSHTADIAVELENGALLTIDVFPGGGTLQELKAMSYDALQLRRLGRAFGILVLVRPVSGGLPQGQVEAIGHGYDVVFGVDEPKAHSVHAYNALLERIKAWVRAAAHG